MKIVSVVGARPQFVKAAPVSRALRLKHIEILVHTGQHYDQNMSDVFFYELGIPLADYHLGVGSGPHGKQTGAMLDGIEEVLQKESPDWVLIYGDTNSTLAGALAASKLHIPVAHVEAGLRSYNRAMPEEVNRVVADNVSTVLFCPTDRAVRNLQREGFENIYHGDEIAGLKISLSFPLVINVGDVMLDAIKYNVRIAGEHSMISTRLKITAGEYAVLTLHRAENVDNPEHLQGILEKLGRMDLQIIFPLHPRTRKRIGEFGLESVLSGQANIRVIEPVGYLDMLSLVKGARVVFTDSGGLQKEAFMLRVPCVTLRNETEWVETVDSGWNILAGLGGEKFTPDMLTGLALTEAGNPYGDGRASERIIDVLEQRDTGTGTWSQ